MTEARTLEPEPYMETVLLLDASHLPAPTGWFFARVESSGYASVEVVTAYEFRPVGEDPAAFAVIAAGSHGHVLLPGATFEPATSRGIERNDHGQRVACCDWEGMGVVEPWRAYAACGEGGPVFEVSPDRPAWVGVVADGWTSDSTLDIVLRGRGAPVTLGAIHKGLEAEAVDLVDRAHQDGSTLRANGERIAGGTGTGRAAWDPDATGLLLLSAEAWGDSAATLTARSGPHVVLDEVLLRKGHALAQVAVPGPLRLALEDVREGTAMRGEASLRVVGLYADVDVPLRVQPTRDGAGAH